VQIIPPGWVTLGGRRRRRTAGFGSTRKSTSSTSSCGAPASTTSSSTGPNVGSSANGSSILFCVPVVKVCAFTALAKGEESYIARGNFAATTQLFTFCPGL
jgi:hypothetical protein